MTEEPEFLLLSKFPRFEIRKYFDSIQARVRVEDENWRGSTGGFRRIAAYIFGRNEGNQKIAMTAPVHMEEINNGTNESVTMKFVMPSDLDLNDLSKPDDPRIEMFKSVEKKYAAISYSGYNNQDKFIKYSQKLRDALLENNLSFTDNPIYLSYDAPYKFWNRKNEVLFELKD